MTSEFQSAGLRQVKAIVQQMKEFYDAEVAVEDDVLYAWIKGLEDALEGEL